MKLSRGHRGAWVAAVLAVAGLLPAACGGENTAAPTTGALALTPEEVWHRLPLGSGWIDRPGIGASVKNADTIRFDPGQAVPVCSDDDPKPVAQVAGGHVTSFSASYRVYGPDYGGADDSAVHILGSVAVLPDEAAARAFAATVGAAVAACGTLVPEPPPAPSPEVSFWNPPQAPAAAAWAKTADGYYTEAAGSGLAREIHHSVRLDGRVVAHLRMSFVHPLGDVELYDSAKLQEAHVTTLLNALDGTESVFADQLCALVPESLVMDATKAAITYRWFLDDGSQQACGVGQPGKDAKFVGILSSVNARKGDAVPPPGSTIIRDGQVRARLNDGNGVKVLTVERTDEADRVYIITTPDPGYTDEQWQAVADAVIKVYVL